MDMTPNAPETGSGTQSRQPSNVIPFLAALRRSAACTPAEMAGVLRRLHRAGITRGFVLVAPTEPGRQPPIEVAEGGDPAHEAWWSGLCNLISTQTGLSAVLVDAAHGGLDPQRVLDGASFATKIAVLKDLTRAERSALLEISRGLCTGDRSLLSEARVLETPTCEPWEVRMAVLGEGVGDLFASTASGALPASA